MHLRVHLLNSFHGFRGNPQILTRQLHAIFHTFKCLILNVEFVSDGFAEFFLPRDDCEKVVELFVLVLYHFSLQLQKDDWWVGERWEIHLQQSMVVEILGDFCFRHSNPNHPLTVLSSAGWGGHEQFWPRIRVKMNGRVGGGCWKHFGKLLLFHLQTLQQILPPQHLSLRPKPHQRTFK